jgi:hypothetical protein
MDDEKNVEIRPYNELGRQGFLPGNPGKPVGAKAKFTKIKEEIADLWSSGKMQEKILKLMESDPKEAREILKVLASLMPKEDVNDSEGRPPLNIIIKGEIEQPGTPNESK